MYLKYNERGSLLFSTKNYKETCNCVTVTLLDGYSVRQSLNVTLTMLDGHCESIFSYKNLYINVY